MKRKMRHKMRVESKRKGTGEERGKGWRRKRRRKNR